MSRAITKWPKMFQCSAVSTDDKPVTVTALAEVNRASAKLVGVPLTEVNGIISRTVPIATTPIKARTISLDG